jgi:large repetitive protein
VRRQPQSRGRLAPMTWIAVGAWVSALGLAAACAGRVESPTTSNVPASSSGGRASAASGGASSGNASAPTSSGGMTITITTIDPSNLLGANCGNGRLDPNEQCDDGNRTRGDGCTTLCQLEAGYECPKLGQPCTKLWVCGNGVVDGMDLCDDGNQISGDGCDETCSTIEPGWQCRVTGRPCAPLCGDGVRAGSEACDEGSSNGTFLQGQTAGCSLGCTLVAHCQSNGATVICPSVCGNGLLELNEQCDLGASNDDVLYGGCATQCKLGPYCGDGVVNENEACDPGLEPVGVYGQPGCTAACQKAPYCGDGLIDTLFGEYCDGGQACDSSCEPFLGP